MDQQDAEHSSFQKAASTSGFQLLLCCQNVTVLAKHTKDLNYS